MWTEVIPIYSTCSILSTIYKWKHMGMPSAGNVISNKPQMLVYTVIYQRIKDHCRYKHCFWAGMWVMIWSTQDSLILVGTRLDENICMHEELNEYESMIRGFFSRNFKFHHHRTLFFFSLPVLLKSVLDTAGKRIRLLWVHSHHIHNS